MRTNAYKWINTLDLEISITITIFSTQLFASKQSQAHNENIIKNKIKATNTHTQQSRNNWVAFGLFDLYFRESALWTLLLMIFLCAYRDRDFHFGNKKVIHVKWKYSGQRQRQQQRTPKIQCGTSKKWFVALFLSLIQNFESRRNNTAIHLRIPFQPKHDWPCRL